MATFYEKLLNIQEIGVKAEKDKQNPHYKSNYVTLDNLNNVVIPLATEQKLVIIHYVSENHLITVVADTESDNSVRSSFPIYHEDPQKIGSTITYGKRYNLGAIFNLITETDDDGNSVAGETSKVDDKPWMNDPEFQNLADNMHMWPDAKSAITTARKKYAVSKMMASKIEKLYGSN